MVFFVILQVLVSLLLIGIILIQKTKSQGLGLSIGAGMGEQLLGAQAGNVLTRATVILTAIFLINTVIIARLGAAEASRSGSVTEQIDPLAIPAVAPVSPVSGQPVDAAGTLPSGMPTAEYTVGPVETPAAAPAPVEAAK